MLDPAPMVLRADGSRHRREHDCFAYCRFDPREGYETELSAYPVHLELNDD